MGQSRTLRKKRDDPIAEILKELRKYYKGTKRIKADAPIDECSRE